MSYTISEFIIHALQKLKKELGEQHADQWVRYWLDDIVDGIRHEHPVIRKVMAGSVVKPLLVLCSNPPAIHDAVDRLFQNLVYRHGVHTYRDFVAALSILSAAQSLGKTVSRISRAEQDRWLLASLDSRHLDLRLDAIAYIFNPLGCLPQDRHIAVRRSTLHLIQHTIERNGNVMDSAFRIDFLRHMSLWIRRIGFRVQRQLGLDQDQQAPMTHDDSLATYEDMKTFYEWLGGYATTWLLFPGASFAQLHIGIQVVLVMAELFGTAPEKLRVHWIQPDTIPRLLGLLLDPFSASRQMVTCILMQLDVPISALLAADETDLRKQATALIDCPRPSESEGGAMLLKLMTVVSCKTDGQLRQERLWIAISEFCDVVRQSIQQASGDILASSLQSPLHGKFMTLRYVFVSSETALTMVGVWWKKFRLVT